MPIEFEKNNPDLSLIYVPDLFRSNGLWLPEKLKGKQSHCFYNTFTISEENRYTFNEQDISPDDMSEGVISKFFIGRLVGDYYHLDRKVLSIDFDLYIHQDIEFTKRLFIAEKEISIFKEFKRLRLNNEVYIGGENPNSLSESEFDNLIKQFPSSYELRKYSASRVCSVLRDNLDIKFDAELSYNKYMKKRIKTKSSDLPSFFQDTEIQKYDFLLEKLQTMLSDQISYTEDKWQEEISQFILLLHPKYIRVFKEV